MTSRLPDLRTPCCNAKFVFHYAFHGLPYLEYERVDEIMCSAEGCYNSWDENGENGG